MDSIIFYYFPSVTIALFLLGLITTITGITILVTRTAGREVRTIAAQTTHLAKKGLAENMAGLVGNASALLDALNQLVRTTRGIGVFLTLIGIILMGSSFGFTAWVAYQIY